MIGPKFIPFLRRLLHRAERRIFLIVDGHPVHRSAVAAAGEPDPEPIYESGALDATARPSLPGVRVSPLL